MKKHLSDLVSLRLLCAILVSFITLMTVTAAFVYLYGKNNINSLIRYSLENASWTAVIEAEQYGEDQVQSWARYYDEEIAEVGNSFVKSTALAEEMKEDSVNSADHGIRSIVDSNGIVVVSTDPGMVGSDIRTDPYLSEFLCLTDGRTDIYSQGPTTNPVNGKDIRYYGAFMPSFGGFYLHGDDCEGFDYNYNFFLEHFTEFDMIGTFGYYLLVNKDGKIISSPDRKYNDASVNLLEDIEKLSESGKIVREDIYGISSYVGALAAGDHYIVAVYPVSEAWEQWFLSMIILILIYTIVFIILFFVTRRLIAANVVKGVYSLNDSLKAITFGNLDEKADFRDSIEFDELSDGINFTVDRLKNLIQEARDRIDAELSLAAQIQTSFLPRVFPAFPDRDEFELYASMTPAKEDVHCAPVAARKKTKFEAGAFDLKAGDILYLYTDGVTEANNSAGEMFRRGRMLEALNKNVNAAVEDIDLAVRRALAEFVQDAPQFDDTTMLVLRYKG